MIKTIVNIEKTKEIFEDLQSDDPKIIINNNSIEMIPNYLNYSFITNFVPILIVMYVSYSFKEDYNLLINLVRILVIPFSIFNIFYQLRYYNRVSFNYKTNIVKITPNFLRSFYTKEKAIPFHNIKNIDYATDGFWLAYRRYILKITLFDSRQFNLISTKEEKHVKKIMTALIAEK